MKGLSILFVSSLAAGLLSGSVHCDSNHISTDVVPSTDPLPSTDVSPTETNVPTDAQGSTRGAPKPSGLDWLLGIDVPSEDDYLEDQSTKESPMKKMTYHITEIVKIMKQMKSFDKAQNGTAYASQSGSIIRQQGRNSYFILPLIFGIAMALDLMKQH